MASLNTKDWTAVEDRMPPTPPEGANLKVRGLIETGNSNITPTLSSAVPQGINPEILILNLALEESGVGNTVMSYREAKFSKDVRRGEHTQVQINADGKKIELIDVQVVN
jgi:hypothetical protein